MKFQELCDLLSSLHLEVKPHGSFNHKYSLQISTVLSLVVGTQAKSGLGIHWFSKCRKCN